MNILYDNNGHGINASSSTWSIREFFGRKGMQIDFDNKIIKNIGNYELDNWDLNFLKNTYAYFNINDYKIIKENKLIIDSFTIEFDFTQNIFKINDRIFNIESHNDSKKPIITILKKKMRVYNGLQGLVTHFTDGFARDFELIEFLKRAYNK